MRRRRVVITAVLAVLVVVGATAVLAGGESLPQRYDTNLSGMTESNEAYQAIQDHYAGKLTQEETLDILLRFWGDIPVVGPTPLPAPTRVPTATAVPSPTPTARPVPTRTPTPKPTATPVHTGMLECESRTSGSFEWDHPLTATTRIARHVEVTIINPDAALWKYGFRIIEDSNYPQVEIYFTHDGKWIIQRRWRWQKDSDYIRIDNLEKHGVLFNRGSGERNQITLFTKTPSNLEYELYVNGVKMPKNRLSGNRNPLPYFAREFRPDRKYQVIGRSQDTGGWWWPDAKGAFTYEGFCTQDAWD